MHLVKNAFTMSWRNLILVAPFFIEIAMGYFMVFLMMLLFGFAAVNFNTFELVNAFEGDMMGFSLMFLGLMLLSFFIYGWIHSFVLSGVIGMIKELLLGEEAKMSQFFAYGKQFVWKTFFIQFIVYLIVTVLTIPMAVYFIKELTSDVLIETIPIALFLTFILYMLISMVCMLIAQFSIISVIRDTTTIGQSIKISLKVMTKGIKDCFILLGVFILLLIPTILLAVILNFIPLAGSLLYVAIQYFLMVVLLVWSVLFYEKFK